MIRYASILFLCALAANGQHSQRSTQRMIDRCAQDGRDFHAWEDDLAKPIQVERDGVTIRIDRPDVGNQNDAILKFSVRGSQLIQHNKDFEAALGWLTTSKSGAFAVTWNLNASAAYTELFTIKNDGEIIANTSLISAAEQTFRQDAKRFCKNPGLNTTAIKWTDENHLLIAINAWSSGFCSSNFTEGFLLNTTTDRISRKLTEDDLLHLPAVCTWNIVPIQQH